MMFGYAPATRQDRVPLALDLSRRFVVRELSQIETGRKVMTYT